jgi:hypothetical protein
MAGTERKQKEFIFILFRFIFLFYFILLLMMFNDSGCQWPALNKFNCGGSQRESLRVEIKSDFIFRSSHAP